MLVEVKTVGPFQEADWAGTGRGQEEGFWNAGNILFLDLSSGYTSWFSL